MTIDVQTILLDNRKKLKELGEAIEDLVIIYPEIFQDAGMKKRLEAFVQAHREAVCRLETPNLLIATIGTTSSGKSTIVNALIGCKVAPIEAGEMSGGVLTLQHSNDRRLIIEETEGATWETGTWSGLSDEAMYDRIRNSVMLPYHDTRNKKHCMAPKVTAFVPLLPICDSNLLELPPGVGVELIDLPGLKSIQDHDNLQVIQEKVRKAFSLVTLDYMQVDDEHRKPLLEELKRVVQYLQGRPDSMIFVLNRVDQRGADDIPISERVAQLKEEIQEVLSLKEPPDIVPFNARLLYYAQCAWGSAPLVQASSVDQPTRSKLLKAMFQDCAGAIYRHIGGNRGLRDWFREVEDRVCDREDIDDQTMREILQYALEWSGGQDLWTCLRNRVQESFLELVILPAIVEVLEDYKSLLENIHKKILEEDNCWDKSDYQNAISQCAKIAHENYDFTNLALEITQKSLNNLTRGIQNRLEDIWKQTQGNSQATTAKEVVEHLQAVKQSLDIDVSPIIQKLRKSLNAKKRNLDYFTIAFIGKTKAGKSTLHAIMAGEGWDGIGVGKQRTTRENIVYKWNNLRIIDTPGIGAPDGKTDEEIALSIIDESDLICYVLTDDSIQETEFQFLRLLKESAKPLVILLNVHKNFRDSKRGPYELEKFLKNPAKLFDIDGHINRIHRYAKQYYGNDYFKIIPVMLLAAQLSSEPEYEQYKDNLLYFSQIRHFYAEIRRSVVDHGDIRRSQTLLGCTVGNIENPYKWVTQKYQNNQKLIQTLKGKRETISDDIEKAAKDAHNSLEFQIKDIFQDVINKIPSFAERCWNYSQIQMEQEWEKEIKNIAFEKRLNIAYEEAIQTFGKEVQYSLEEVGQELKIIAQLGKMTISFNQQDSDDVRNFLQIGGGFIGIAATVMVFIPPLAIAGVIIGTIAGIISIIGGFWKSKGEKRRDAVANIDKSLRNQLNGQKKNTLDQSLKQLNNNCNEVTANIDNYFKDLIEGLVVIDQQLESTQNTLQLEANKLNRAYAKRIIDWCLKQYEPLTDNGIDNIVATVSRDFGRSINIKTKILLQLERSQDEINRVLQKNVCIQITDTSKNYSTKDYSPWD